MPTGASSSTATTGEEGGGEGRAALLPAKRMRAWRSATQPARSSSVRRGRVSTAGRAGGGRSVPDPVRPGDRKGDRSRLASGSCSKPSRLAQVPPPRRAGPRNVRRRKGDHIIDYELATRLSTSSVEPARQGTDRSAGSGNCPTAVLEQQGEAYAGRPKAKALTDNFRQWLQIGKVRRPGRARVLPRSRRRCGRPCTTRRHLLRPSPHRRPPRYRLLDATTLTSRDLAKHYGLGDVKGKEMRKSP